VTQDWQVFNPGYAGLLPRTGRFITYVRMKGLLRSMAGVMSKITVELFDKMSDFGILESRDVSRGGI
jgi:hypothetical protein